MVSGRKTLLDCSVISWADPGTLRQIQILTHFADWNILISAQRKAVECIPSEWRRWTITAILLHSQQKNRWACTLGWIILWWYLSYRSHSRQFQSPEIPSADLRRGFFLFKTNEEMYAVILVKFKWSFFPNLRPDISEISNALGPKLNRLDSHYFIALHEKSWQKELGLWFTGEAQGPFLGEKFTVEDPSAKSWEKPCHVKNKHMHMKMGKSVWKSTKF